MTRPPVRGLAAIWHVIVKDLRRHGIALAGYAAVVVMSAGFGVSSATLPSLVPIAVILVGVVMAVLLVHSDPPFRRRAYWALHPIAPGAVYGAKLLEIFGGILGLALVGQGVVLAGYGITTAEIPGLLLASVPVAGAFLLAALLLATSFRTLSGIAAAVAVGLVLLPVLSGVFFMVLLVGIVIPVTAMGTALVWGGAAVAGLVWAGYRYATPEGSTGGRFLGAVLALLVALGGLAWITTGSGSARAGGASGVHPDELVAAHPALEGVTVELLSVNGGGSGSSGRHLNVVARIQAQDSSAAYRFRPESARLILADGSSQSLEVDPRIVEQYGVPPGIARRWVGRSSSIFPVSGVRIRPDPSQWEILRAGDARMRLTAVVERLESREIGDMRFGAGESWTSGGVRVRLSESEAGGPGAVSVHELAVISGARGSRSGPSGASLFGASRAYAVLSPGAEEGVALRWWWGGSGSGPGRSLFSRAGLLLPGPTVREWRGEWAVPPEALDELDPGWLDRARLHAFEWVVVGTDRVVSEPMMLSPPGEPPTPTASTGPVIP